MKFKKIILATLVGFVFIAGITLLVLYKIGDRVFDEVLQQQMQAIEQGIDLSEVTPTLTPTPTPAQTPTPTVTPASDNNKAQGGDAPATPQPTPTPALPEPTLPPVITVQELEKVKDNVSAADKISVAAMVLTKLSQSEITTLTKLASGGITAEEKEELKKVLNSKFTEAEIEKIKVLYDKYMGKP